MALLAEHFAFSFGLADETPSDVAPARLTALQSHGSTIHFSAL
jgi:hypothetical protein